MRNYLVSTIKSNRRSILMLAVFILLAMVFLAGCSMSAKDSSSSQTENKSKIKVELPANFPEKFPRREEDKLLAAKQDLDDIGTTVYYATWEVKSSPQEIINYYKQYLPANGWQIEKVIEGDAPDITFRKAKDLKSSNLRVTIINDKQVLQVRVY